MFTIYEEGVRSFSGTLERLYEVRPTEPPGAVHREAPAPGDTGSTRAGHARGEGHAPSAAVISAYRNATKLTTREPILHAHQIMRSPIVSVRADADVADAWLLLREHGIRQMPVQTPQVELVGLVSERELLEHLVVERGHVRYGQDRAVSDVMHREVITAEPVTEVRRIALVMVDRKMTAMPIVTSQDELVGIVSRGDLLRAMARTPPLTLWT